jgi:MOSC domain-containing protein YiiM
MVGRVERIWVKRVEGETPDEVSSATALANAGFEGNYRLGGRRQVTVLSAQAWDAVQKEMALTLDPALRRANVLVSGIDLEASKGRILRLGTVSILVRGETKPCNLMEAACPGLREALAPHWRGGIYGEVLTDGEITVGDAAAFQGPPSG